MERPQPPNSIGKKNLKVASQQEEGNPISFQAKVKGTEQLFVATNEVDKDGAWGKDARKLEKDKSYVGYLFSARSEYSSAPGSLQKPTITIFKIVALEELSIRLKLVVEIT